MDICSVEEGMKEQHSKRNLKTPEHHYGIRVKRQKVEVAEGTKERREKAPRNGEDGKNEERKTRRKGRTEEPCQINNNNTARSTIKQEELGPMDMQSA